MDGAEPQHAAYTLTAAELDAARFGFQREHKHRSAKRVLYFTQLLAFAAVGSGFVIAVREATTLTLMIVHYAAMALFAVAILWRLAAASNLKPLLWRLAAPAQWPTYTILCPLYREAGVIADLADALCRLDYPGFLHQLHPRTV